MDIVTEDEYLNLYHHTKYAYIIFNKYYLKLKSAKITDMQINPLFTYSPTMEDIKYYFRKYISDEWTIDMDDFEEKYSKLTQAVHFGTTAIFVKFDQKKYLELFNIKQNLYNDFLFFPYILNITFNFVTLDGVNKEGIIEIKFNRYYENTLIVSESKSKIFCLDPIVITNRAHEILFKNEKDPEVQKDFDVLS